MFSMRRRFLYISLFASLIGTVPLITWAANIPVMRPRVIVLTAFPPEFLVWKKTHHYLHVIWVRGLRRAMICNTQATCIVETGEGEVNAAISVSALADDPHLNVRKTLFIRSGIAGGVADHEALGSVYIANWIVAWGFGHHYLNHTTGTLAWAPSQPPYSTNHWETLRYRLNPRLVKKAWVSTQHVPLANNAFVKKLDTTMGLHHTPQVLVGANVSGNDFWIGRENETLARTMTRYYTHGQAHYATTAMEDLGDVAALNAYGLQAHYLSIRAISDIDIPPPATSVHAIIAKGDEYAGALACKNAYRVTDALIHALT